MKVVARFTLFYLDQCTSTIIFNVYHVTIYGDANVNLLKNMKLSSTLEEHF